MKRPPRPRPALECLEDRCCPSVSAHVSGGNLLVTGSTSDLTITEVSAGRFDVADSTADRGTFTVTKDVDVDLSTRDRDQVTLNLNHNTAPGGVHIHVSGGDPSVSVFGGTITGNLSIVGGPGADTVVLGGQASGVPSLPIPPPPTPAADGPGLPAGPSGPPPVGLPAPGPGLHVEGDTYVRLGGNRLGTVRVSPWVDLDGALDLEQVGQVELMLASRVGKSATLVGGPGGIGVLDDGNVVGNLTIRGLAGTGSFFYLSPMGRVGGNLSTTAVGGVQFADFSQVVGRASVTGADSLTAAGTVGGDLVFQGAGWRPETLNVQHTAEVRGNLRAHMGDGTDTANLFGQMDGSVFLQTGAGNDAVQLGGVVDGDAAVALGAGGDHFSLWATLGKPGGPGGNLDLDAGPGDDSAFFAGTAVVRGTLSADMGPGNDIAAAGPGFQASGVVDGGSGRDGLEGFFPATVHPRNFEYAFAVL